MNKSLLEILAEAEKNRRQKQQNILDRLGFKASKPAAVNLPFFNSVKRKTRRVFFSFHYQRDIFRVSQIRNSWITKPDRESAGFWDSADWESVKRSGDLSIKRWINSQLKGTSVTIVLIGSETANRKYVQYEIEQSYKKENQGMLGVYIHRMKDINKLTSVQGPNPFDNYIVTDRFGFKRPLSQYIKTYDWILDQGYQNLGTWVDEAASNAGR